jgi:hypothetical protein
MSERFYPTLPPETPHETSQAIKIAYDNLYELRDQMKTQNETHQQAMGEMQKKHESLQSQIDGQKFTSNIQGLGIKGITDGLSDGMTLKWSASEGQFVIKL